MDFFRIASSTEHKTLQRVLESHRFLKYFHNGLFEINSSRDYIIG